MKKITISCPHSPSGAGGTETMNQNRPEEELSLPSGSTKVQKNLYRPNLDTILKQPQRTPGHFQGTHKTALLQTPHKQPSRYPHSGFLQRILKFVHYLCLTCAKRCKPAFWASERGHGICIICTKFCNFAALRGHFGVFPGTSGTPPGSPILPPRSPVLCPIV